MKKHSPQPINRLAKWKYIVLVMSLIVMLLSALPSIYGENAALHTNHRGQVTEATQISQYLEHSGITPIALGLDLRGRVQFLLEVDMAPVYQAHQQMVIDEFTTEFRASRGRITNDGVQLTLFGNNDPHQARNFVRQQFPNWDSSLQGSVIRLSQSDEERNTLRNLTVQQNLQIMRERISELGITEASVQRQGENRIRIELPGVQDPAAAKDVIGVRPSHYIAEKPSEEVLL